MGGDSLGSTPAAARGRRASSRQCEHSDNATFGRRGQEVHADEQKRLDDQIFVDAHWSDSRRCARRKYQRLLAAAGLDARRSSGAERYGGCNHRRSHPPGGRGRVGRAHPTELVGLLGGPIQRCVSKSLRRSFCTPARPKDRASRARRVPRRASYRVSAVADSAFAESAFEVAIPRHGQASWSQHRTAGSKVVRVRESEESNVGVLR